MSSTTAMLGWAVCIYAMPYPNEHSCRLESPEDCDQVRRQNDWQEHEGKRIDAIWCIKGDKAHLQAMRYPTEQWGEVAARKH